MRRSKVIFTAAQAAKDLWDFGEDEYVEKALSLTDSELKRLHMETYTLLTPNSLKILGTRSQDYNLGMMTAFALIVYFEGKRRPLARKRRRNANLLPARLDYNPDMERKIWMRYI